MKAVWGGGTAREGIPETAGTADEQSSGKQTSGAFTVGEGGGKAERWGRIHADQSGTTLRREPIRRTRRAAVVLFVCFCERAPFGRLACWRVAQTSKNRTGSGDGGHGSRQSCVCLGHTRGTPGAHPGHTRDDAIRTSSRGGETSERCAAREEGTCGTRGTHVVCIQCQKPITNHYHAHHH